MTYDNIKNHKKKQGFTLSLEDTFFKKPQGGVKLIPLAVLGFNIILDFLKKTMLNLFTITANIQGGVLWKSSETNSLKNA